MPLGRCGSHPSPSARTCNHFNLEVVNWSLRTRNPQILDKYWPSSTETDLRRLFGTVTLLAPFEGNYSIRCLISLDPGDDPGHSGETPYWDASFFVPFWLFVRPRLKAWSNALLLFT